MFHFFTMSIMNGALWHTQFVYSVEVHFLHYSMFRRVVIWSLQSSSLGAIAFVIYLVFNLFNKFSRTYLMIYSIFDSMISVVWAVTKLLRKLIKSLHVRYWAHGRAVYFNINFKWLCLYFIWPWYTFCSYIVMRFKATCTLMFFLLSGVKFFWLPFPPSIYTRHEYSCTLQKIGIFFKLG